MQSCELAREKSIVFIKGHRRKKRIAIQLITENMKMGEGEGEEAKTEMDFSFVKWTHATFNDIGIHTGITLLKDMKSKI